MSSITNGLAPGVAAPAEDVQKSERPVGAGQVAWGSVESASIVAPERSDDKLRATLKASFCLRGYAVHDTAEGGYLVVRWNLAKHCPDLRALVQFAKQVGARA